MNSFIDTSVLVRYLTGDSPELAEKAAKIIDSDREIYITDVVIVETAYVLTSIYRISRVAVVDNLLDFIQKENVRLFGLDKAAVLQGLLLCRPSGRISFGDAMIWATAKSLEDCVVYTFDERFPDDEITIANPNASPHRPEPRP